MTIYIQRSNGTKLGCERNLETVDEAVSRREARELIVEYRLADIGCRRGAAGTGLRETRGLE